MVRLFCSNCTLLTKIPNIEELKTLDCYECPLLVKLPNFRHLTYFNEISFTKELLSARYILTCFRYKFKIPIKSKQLFKINLEKYSEHILDDYVNPNSKYMKYYVNDICSTPFDNDFEEKLKIGYLSKDNNELKMLTLK